ncbi:hypothetical protein [Streptomyces nitrosporeus]|uniref:hypothetical protein n=1 Tax=Streptomyces nitrosporeus TaxID=28894 RepID=UPI0039A20856
MDRNTSLTTRPSPAAARRVRSARQLRAEGVTAARAAARCLPGGPWQQLLPGVYLLHPGPPTDRERLCGALLYAGRTGRGRTGPGHGGVMVTGPAALALYGFTSVPPMTAPHRIDVLVPRTRRLRSTRFVRVVRAARPPGPAYRGGTPVAPVERALADTVATLTDAAAVRRLLVEAVRGGHCEPAAVVHELSAARLLGRAQVAGAVDGLLAEGRAVAEDRLYGMVRGHSLPEPLWNVDLRLPGGAPLGRVDAYWPEPAVALLLGARTPREAGTTGRTADREHLERLGITVVRVTARGLREAADRQAEAVRTAMAAAEDREPAAYVVVLPG